MGTETVSTRAAGRQRFRDLGAWGGVGDPERPPSPGSSVDVMLALARRFAIAYMPYQVGRLPGWARAAITRTCTPTFARYLLVRPAEQSPAADRSPERRRDLSRRERQPCRRLEPSLGQLRLGAGSSDTGAFLLTLAHRHGRWLVAGLET